MDLSFTQQGGHSLHAINVVSRSRSSGIELSIGSVLLSPSLEELLDSATTALASKINHDSAGVEEMLPPDSHGVPRPDSTMVTQNICMPISDRTGAPRTIQSDTKLTEMQSSFIHSFLKDPSSNAISFYESFRPEDIPFVKAAWKAVTMAEPIFRLSFEAADTGEVFEFQDAPFRWNEIVVENQDEYNAAIQNKGPVDALQVAFDVVSLPSENISTVIWRVHHVFIDGISAQLVYRKMHAFLAGGNIVPGTPFKDVARELEIYRKARKEFHKAFWARQSRAHPQPAHDLSLRSVPINTGAADDSMGSISFDVPFNAIADKAREVGVSIPAWYQAAWALVLSWYTDSDSVTFGTVLSGRHLAVDGVNDTIGPLINTLPFNVTVDQEQLVADYLQSVFQHSVQLGEVQCSSPEDGFTRQFSSALSMEFEMEMETPNSNATVRPVGPSWFHIIPDIPLSVYMTFKGTIRLCYLRSRYTDVHMQLLADHFRNAIIRMCSLTTSLKHIMGSLISPRCREILADHGNSYSRATHPQSVKEDLVTLFEKVACEHPSALALEKSNMSLTYMELDRGASLLASILSKEYSVAPGDVVCVHADRSINWIVAIMAILKTGAVYSAQDVSLPAHVRDTNFKTAGARLFLTPATSQQYIRPQSCHQCLSVEELLGDATGTGVSMIHHRATPRPSDNAYLCFTSGSTGKPKGVMCHHAGLVAFQTPPEVRFFAGPGRRISQLMSPAFDGSIHEIFSALTYGATLVLSDESTGDPFAHLKKVDAALLTPSIASMLNPTDYVGLRTVYLVGEPVPQRVNDLWSQDTTRGLYNMYGPTEATCGATIKRLHAGHRVTIGKPNPSTRVYIMDRNQTQLPPGAVGEIYCAGVQVAKGYMGRPDLTAERFLADTISPDAVPGEFMYRTGDLGFFNSHGEIECIGRNDRQIKLRGFRIDLEDLETRIGRAIEGATAVAVCPNTSKDHLVCMLRPGTLDPSVATERARDVLPPHAVPRYMVPVEEFPMTTAGKIDYKAIANWCVGNKCPEHAETIKFQKPLSTSEATLARLWREVLDLSDAVDIQAASNFTALGGHSILLLRLSQRLAKLHNVRNLLPLLARSSTLSDQAMAIENLKASRTKGITSHDTNLHSLSPLQPLGSDGVSPIEQDWLLKYKLNVQGTSSFNVTYACAVDPSKIDIERLVVACNTILQRHAIFSSRFETAADGSGARRTLAGSPPQVKIIDQGQFNLRREVNRPFRLDRNEHLIRVFISEACFLLVVSHILADLTTLEKTLQEIGLVYHNHCLGPVEHAYKDTIQWSRPVTSSQMDWWKANLKDSPRDYGLPMQLNRASYDGESTIVQLDTELATRVLRSTEDRKVTPHQLALASVAMALQLHRGDTDIVLGAPYLNRETEDMETMGLFLEPLPIRIKYDPEARDSGDFLSAVQRSSQSAISQAVSWHRVIEAAGADEAGRFWRPNHPLLDIMVTFHDHRANKDAIEGLHPLITYAKGSKFLLLVEFTAIHNGGILLRLEYDNKCITKSIIARIQQLIIEALNMIVDGTDYMQVKGALRDSPWPENPCGFFGRKLNSF